MSSPPSWRGCLNFYIAEQKLYNNLYLPCRTRQRNSLSSVQVGRQTASIFPLWFANLFFPSFQSLKQNLQDEAMYNGVKWELFTSLTRRERLHAQTKDGFWTIKLGLSIFGISRKTQCADRSRRERSFKKAFVPPSSSPRRVGNKAVTCHFSYPLKAKVCEIASVLNHSWGNIFM